MTTRLASALLAMLVGAVWLATAPPVSAAAPAPAPADVAAPPATARKAASGLATRIIVRGSGKKHPRPNDCVKIHYTAWTRTGQVAGMSSAEGLPATQCLRRMSPGMLEAVTAMVPGEQRRVWIPKNLAFPPDPKEEEPARAEDLTYDLTLVEIVAAPATPPSLKGPTVRAHRAPSGVAYEVLKQGTSDAHPSTTGRISMHLSGWTSAGVLFESTAMAGQPASYALDELIPGLREVLPQMVVGDRFRIWVPAAQAYGEKPRRRGQPGGNLVYDIEVTALQ